jgi:hypothetical protein
MLNVSTLKEALGNNSGPTCGDALWDRRSWITWLQRHTVVVPAERWLKLGLHRR